MLIGPYKQAIRRSIWQGLFFAYSQSIRFIYIAFVFYIASLFIKQYNLDKESVFTACYVVFVGAIGSGVSISQMPSVSKAQQAAKTIFRIIEEQSEINPKQPGA